MRTFLLSALGSFIGSLVVFGGAAYVKWRGVRRFMKTVGSHYPVTGGNLGGPGGGPPA